MKTSLFDYHLPQERIAQTPATPRDSSKLLVLPKDGSAMQHRIFHEVLDYFRAGDILVVNNSRVIPARLFGQKPTGGKVELLLLEKLGDAQWQALARGKKLREGTSIHIYTQSGEMSDVVGQITAVTPDSPQREISFNQPIDALLDELGHTPLPPYIHASLPDNERYQTVYSQPRGSSAAPTAGLHFTPELLLALREKGVMFETCTLHVGLDTFKPVEADEIQAHHIHSEWATLSPEAAKRINEAKLAGGRLFAVGTTAVRTLETAALRSAGITGSLQTISQQDADGQTTTHCPWKPVTAFAGATDLYIYPGYRFRAVDALITNFHLPQSSLLMLVSAFVGRERMLGAYETAVAQQYRFFSFGDAMLIF